MPTRLVICRSVTYASRSPSHRSAQLEIARRGGHDPIARLLEAHHFGRRACVRVRVPWNRPRLRRADAARS